MIRLDENALICDLAETYHIYDYRGLPCKTVAVLASGLGENSRIRSKASGLSVSLATFISAVQADALRALIWMQTKDGHKGSKRPESMAEKMLLNHTTKKAIKRTYKARTMEDFAKMYAEKYGRKL